MLIFNAGNAGGAKSEDLFYDADSGTRNRLLTYADIDNLSAVFDFWLNPDLKDKKLFLDSGAYSAFTRDVKISMKELIDYIKLNQKEIFAYAVLDVIGDDKATRKNYLHMRRAGLNPVAVFHYGSPYKELERYCKEGCDYVALGGLVPLRSTKTELERHLDKCWRILRKCWPIKVHAFGVTAQETLKRYPFYSCDSTVAIVGGGRGLVMNFENGRFKKRSWSDYAKQGKHATMVDNLNKDGSHHMARQLHNIRTIARLEQYITDLWESRGITWKE